MYRILQEFLALRRRGLLVVCSLATVTTLVLLYTRRPERLSVPTARSVQPVIRVPTATWTRNGSTSPSVVLKPVISNKELESFKEQKFRQVTQTSLVHHLSDSELLVALAGEQIRGAVRSEPDEPVASIQGLRFFRISNEQFEDILRFLEVGNHSTHQVSSFIEQHAKQTRLAYRGSVKGMNGFLDFVVSAPDKIDLVLTADNTTCRVLRVTGALDGDWEGDGVILAERKKFWFPRVSAAHNGENCHFFWAESEGNTERLLHSDGHATTAPEILCAAERLAYRAVALSNGDLAVLCKAYNFQRTEFDSLGISVGEDVSLNLRINRNGIWSAWTRVKYLDSVDVVSRKLPYLLNFNLSSCGIQEVSQLTIELLFFERPGGMAIEYYLPELAK